MIKQKQAFTLVELIVVITILAILGTIAFISLQAYTRDARDSVRISDMKNIEKGFEIEITTKGKLPIPEDKIDITASGIVISYQGYAGKKILNQLGISGGTDPLDKTYYTYVSNSKLTKYQLMGFLEGNIVGFNNNIIKTANALELEERIPYTSGSELGVLLSTGTLNPVQLKGNSIDIVNTNVEYITYLKNNITSTGTGKTISVALAHVINEEGSCNSILKNGNSKGDGIYNIDPEKDGVGFSVYCDMNSNGGGWTLLSSVPGESEKYGNIGTWKDPTYDNIPPKGLINKEFLSKAYGQLTTNEILLCNKNTNFCYNFKHNKNIPFYNFFKDNISYVDYSFNLAGYGDQGNINKLTKYFSTFGYNGTSYLRCGMLGINHNRLNNNTSFIIGYGGDWDGPCINKNNSFNNGIDNGFLGLTGRLWYLSTISRIQKPNLAGYQSYNITNSISKKNLFNQTYFISDTWHVFGK